MMMTILSLVVTLLTVTPLVHMTSSSTQQEEDLVLLRIEVQNLPPDLALSSTQTFPIAIRVSRPSTLQQLEQVVSQQITTKDQPLAFDLEVFSFQDRRFVALQSLNQLRKRTRLNVILKNLPDKLSSTCVALPFKMFDISDGSFRINNHRVLIEEVGNSGKGTGLTTWDGSVVLAKYLEHATLTTHELSIRGKTVLEVGAGTGVVGISAAMLGAQQVVLTDLPYTMENLAKNIQRNVQNYPTLETILSTRVIDWFDPPQNVGQIDLILAADVVWIPELIPPLVQALHALVTRSSSAVRPRVLMSYQKRSVHSDELLFDQLEKHHFKVSTLPQERFHPDFVSDRIDILEFSLIEVTEKPETQ